MKIESLIEKGLEIATSMKSKYLFVEHILMASIEDDKIKSFLKSEKINIKKINEDIKIFLSKSPIVEQLTSSEQEVLFSKPVSVFLAYFNICQDTNKDVIDDEDILFIISLISSFILMEDTVSQRILFENGIDRAFIAKMYKDNATVEDIKNIYNELEEPKKNKDALKIYTEILTDKDFSKCTPVIGRDKEIETIKHFLMRYDNPNVILVGKSGVGKTKIIEKLAQELKEENKVIYSLNTLALMSNIMLKGEMENRIKSIHDSFKKLDKEIIFFIDDIHSLFNGNDSNGEISSLIKPILADNNIKVIGTTTFEDYRKNIEKDAVFSRRCFKLNIEEPSEEETMKIIQGVSKNYSKFYNIKYSNKILQYIMNSSKKYFINRAFPDKALYLMDMVGAKTSYKGLKSASEEIVNETLSMILNIPLTSVNADEEKLYKTLEETLKKNIIGQDVAISQVSDAVIVSRSGLRESNKTAISLLFRGSTGCGKTELCRELAKQLGIDLVRFDMSEYVEEHSISKLIGSPPGYKDSGNGKSGNGLLINAIEEHPYCILLLDEIEKAHPKVHNLLLQVMDNGELTSSTGHSVSFENVFLIMTSNAGSYNTNKMSIGFGTREEDPSEEDFNLSFLPEFRNRLDKVVVFNSLSDDVLKGICKKFLEELKTILKNKSLEFNYEDDILDYIIKKVNKKQEGARPLKHIITNEIKNVIAKNIMFGTYKQKKSVNLKLIENKLVFE